LIILIILGEDYKLWSSSLCNFLQPPVTSSLFGPIFSSAPCSQTPSVYVPHLRDQVSHPYRTTGKIDFRTCFDIFFDVCYLLILQFDSMQCGLQTTSLNKQQITYWYEYFSMLSLCNARHFVTRRIVQHLVET
jgi:hypothetical protein